MDDRLPVLCEDTILLFVLLPYPLLCADDELAKVIRGYWLTAQSRTRYPLLCLS